MIYKYCFIFFFVIICRQVHSQNLIVNPDFELYNNCPTSIGQVDTAISWVQVVRSADYYNCGLTTWVASNSQAYSGTGFMGFSGYTNASGNAEAIGQYLTQPLIPGQSYSISFAAKKPYPGGNGSAICGGVACYGFHDSIPHDTVSVHLSQLSGSELLGVSAVVQDTSWQVFWFSFIPSDTIRAIGFTIQLPSLCYEYIFLDSINLLPSPLSIEEDLLESSIKVFPNPAKNYIVVKCDNLINEVKLYDLRGGLISRYLPNEFEYIVPILKSGFYFIEINCNNITFRKKILATRE